MGVFDSVQNMKNAIGKEVTITTLNGKTHWGNIFSIDPTTKTVLLTNPACQSVDVIMHHSIKNLTLSEHGKNLKASPTPQAYTSLKEKKLKLMKWLKCNLIEVQEDGDALKISDHVIIDAPYDLDHCYCASTVVLERLREIINRMPA